VSGGEALGPWRKEQDRLVLGLRRTAGVVAGPGGRRLMASPAGRRLLEAGILVEDEGRLRVARPLLGVRQRGPCWHSNRRTASSRRWLLTSG